MVLVPEIGALGLALFCLALALAAAVVVKAIIDFSGGLPVIGSAIKAVLNPLAHALSWAAGQLESGVDAILGATFHTLAKVLEWTFDYYKSQAALLLQLAHLVGGQLSHSSGLAARVLRLEKVWHGIESGVKTLNREYHGIDRRVNKLERELAKGIGHDLRITVAGLESEVNTLEKHVVPGLRQGIKTAEGEVTQLENFIKAIPGTRYLEWAAGIVAAGLATFGNGWLSCKENPFSSSRNPCGLWADFARFLPLLGLLAIGFDFPEFVQAAETVAQGIGGAVGAIEGTFALELPPLPPPA